LPDAGLRLLKGYSILVTWIALYFALPDFPPKTHDVSYFQMVSKVWLRCKTAAIERAFNSPASALEHVDVYLQVSNVGPMLSDRIPDIR